MMRIFTFDDRMSAVCISESTRSGFRHLATLMREGRETTVTAKCTYQNRTWESYDFQSVLFKLVENSAKLLDSEKREAYREMIENVFS